MKFIVGNKMDLIDLEQVSYDEANKYARVIERIMRFIIVNRCETEIDISEGKERNKSNV